jgi:hypothetical protein
VCTEPWHSLLYLPGTMTSTAQRNVVEDLPEKDRLLVAARVLEILTGEPADSQELEGPVAAPEARKHALTLSTCAPGAATRCSRVRSCQCAAFFS